MNSNCLKFALALSLTPVLAPAVAQATDRTWDGGGGTRYWTNRFNWVGDVAPVAGDNLRIPGSANQRTTNTFPAVTSFGNVRLGSGYQEIHGNLLRLSGGMRFDDDAFGQGIGIFTPVELTAAQDFILTSAVYPNFHGTFNLGGQTLQITCQQAINNGTTFSGPLTGTGSFLVGSNAYVNLEGTNSFSGSVVVRNKGNLSNSGRNPNGPAWLVQAGGRLRLEEGFVPGATVAAGGELELSVGPPHFGFIAGDLLLQPAATFKVLVSYDYRLVVTGAVTVASAVLDVFPYDYQAFPNNVYTILENIGADPVSGSFAGLPEGAILTYLDASYRISYLGGDGNDITLTLLVPPATGVTRVWDGGGADAYWWNENNWGGNVRPNAGDEVVFPAAASQKANTNDLSFWGVGGFNSLRFDGASYELREAYSPNRLLLQQGLVAANLTGTNVLRLNFSLYQTQTWTVAHSAALLRLAELDDAAPGESTNTFGSGTLRKAGAGTLAIGPVALAHAGGTLADGGVLRLLEGARVEGDLALLSGTLEARSAVSGPFTGTAGVLRLGGAMPTLSDPDAANGLMVRGDATLRPGVIFTPQLDGTNEFHPHPDGTAGLLAFEKGRLDLGNATLLPEVNCSPRAGDVFTIALDLNADGGNITNTFAGLPQGATNQVGPWRFRITYQGEGNRAVQLTALIRAPVFTSVQRKASFAILNGAAEPLRPVQIKATTDFIGWTDLGQTVADNAGHFEFVDPEAGNFPYRFYRAIGL